MPFNIVPAGTALNSLKNLLDKPWEETGAICVTALAERWLVHLHLLSVPDLKQKFYVIIVPMHHQSAANPDYCFVFQTVDGRQRNASCAKTPHQNWAEHGSHPSPDGKMSTKYPALSQEIFACVKCSQFVLQKCNRSKQVRTITHSAKQEQLNLWIF